MPSTKLKVSAASVLSTTRLNLLADHEMGAHMLFFFFIQTKSAPVLFTLSFRFEKDASVDNSMVQFSTGPKSQNLMKFFPDFTFLTAFRASFRSFTFPFRNFVDISI